MNTVLTIKMPKSIPVSESRDHYARNSRAYGTANYPEFVSRCSPAPTARDKALGNGGGTAYSDEFQAETPDGVIKVDSVDLRDLRSAAGQGRKVGDWVMVACWVE